MEIDKLTDTNIRRLLKNYIQEQDIKKHRYARLCNVSDATISLFLKGERTLSKQNLVTIYKDINEKNNE